MGKHPKPKERQEARRLRRELGMPMKEIAARLGVSPSSVHGWTKDIEIGEEWLLRNRREGHRRFLERWIESNRERRRGYQEEGRARARQGGDLHEAGCMLYWAEGAKHRNVLTFSNSDPSMVCFFLTFLRTSFDVEPERIIVRLNVYLGNGYSLRQIEQHWLNLLELPRACLRGHTVNHFPTSSSGRKKNKLPYGVCSLRLRASTPIVQHIYGAIQEYAGFDEPRWLDC
jgi:hypothetical protein